MKIKDIEIKVQTNADEEIEKVKELVILLERTNELIQSLNNIKITNLEELFFSIFYTSSFLHFIPTAKC